MDAYLRPRTIHGLGAKPHLQRRKRIGHDKSEWWACHSRRIFGSGTSPADAYRCWLDKLSFYTLETLAYRRKHPLVPQHCRIYAGVAMDERWAHP